MEKKLLWIEDDADILSNLVTPLIDSGFIITTIRNYSEYLQIPDAEFATFAVAVIDLLLPPGNEETTNNNELGITIIQHIRKTRKSLVPIIAITGISELIPKVDEEDWAPIVTMEKAILASELLEEVENLLE